MDCIKKLKRNDKKNDIFTILPKHCNFQVRGICEIYDKLYSISKSLNSIYSLHILLTINAAFITLVYQMYFLYLIINPQTPTKGTYENLWMAIAWSVVSFVSIFPISFICGKVQDEVILFQYYLA